MKRKRRAAKAAQTTKPRNPATAARAAEPTERQGAYLEAVAELGKAASGLAIAEKVGVSRTGIRAQLDALVRKGLVKERKAKVVVGYTLTEAGKALIAGNDRGQP